MDLKTYHGWMQVGRAVRKGESAEFYLVDPTGTQSRAVFAEDQTDPYDAALLTKDWTTVVPADERPVPSRSSAATKDPRPKVIVEYSTADHTLAVWCGRNKWIIAGLKKSGFIYDSHSHRWRGQRDDPHAAARGLEHEEHARVELFVDGEAVAIDGPRI